MWKRKWAETNEQVLLGRILGHCVVMFSDAAETVVVWKIKSSSASITVDLQCFPQKAQSAQI